MDTPIVRFLEDYAASGVSRLHMPGHKGLGPLGCESWDVTEVAGADALYQAAGIIARSEENTASLFGAARTVYSTEGSSQAIRAMLRLALAHRREGTPPVILAARNVHKALVYAAALLDCEVVWLYPEENDSICSCPITARQLESALRAMPQPPAAVYLTSPDYLGGMADLPALAEVAHRFGTLLLVDNAHGAYLRFLRPSLHPLDLGADLCCDSAHKTLPVLTGGAYLHVGRHAPSGLAQDAKRAMELFGSTSPSYLILASLDLCVRWMAEQAEVELDQCVKRTNALRTELRARGWRILPSDPLRVTLRAPEGVLGTELADRLRRGGAECEYADPEHLVLMIAPNNREEDFRCVLAALGENGAPYRSERVLPTGRGERVLSIRQAVLAPWETVPVEKALGRVCAAPTVSCPPAIPIAVSGERIGNAALELLLHYGVTHVDVVK